MHITEDQGLGWAWVWAGGLHSQPASGMGTCTCTLLQDSPDETLLGTVETRRESLTLLHYSANSVLGNPEPPFRAWAFVPIPSLP